MRKVQRLIPGGERGGFCFRTCQCDSDDGRDTIRDRNNYTFGMK